MKNPYFKREVKAIKVGRKSISRLLKEMSETGFQGRKLGEALDVWEEMLNQNNLTIFMGYAGSMSTTGQWKIINWLIKKRFIDVLISTGANISEDLYNAMGYKYWKGTHMVDDKELLRYKIDRFYDVFASEMDYREMEYEIRRFMENYKNETNISSRQFLYEFGNHLRDKGIRSIVATASENRVPVFSPAIVDSGYGIAALYARRNGSRLSIDQFADFEETVKIAKRTRKTAVVYNGGGVPKDYLQLTTVAQALEHSSDKVFPHEYAIQFTTDSPQWGGLSGCTFEEAISWGKIASRGRNVVCYVDSTIALPLVAHGLNERVSRRKYYPKYDWLFD